MKERLMQFLIRNNIGYMVPRNFGLVFWNRFHQYVLGINIKAKCPVHFTSRIDGYRNIIMPKQRNSIVTSFVVSGGCYFTIFPGTTLEIGEGTIWSYNVCIQTGDHDAVDRSIHHKGNIKLGKNCWIAANVTITKGVELGDNVTVGANSVVTKSFPSNVVIGGVPAKIIRQLEIPGK
ncbi:MAG: acyltransferase [Chitinophagaceae bacterium]|nr:acyltransferase [Chitinophagaceae bacterium]